MTSSLWSASLSITLLIELYQLRLELTVFTGSTQSNLEVCFERGAGLFNTSMIFYANFIDSGFHIHKIWSDFLQQVFNAFT